MAKVAIGKAGKRSVWLDLAILMKTRMLITANSGGGKSWLIRLLAELLFPYVQVIIIDPEGEFATLRKKFPYVLVGKGGETPADVRTAELLAHKLLEHKISAVCDLFELKPHLRHEWIKVFVEALMEAPRHLWRHVVIIIDEAHKVVPEKGQGESVAHEAVLDLVTRGRKRGYCPILASQRHAKVSKSATAELLNRLVGPTFEDADIDRAILDLSIPKDGRQEFKDEIKLLEEGNFNALGRAISKERILFKVGQVETPHPEAGDDNFSAEPPPAPEKVKALLPKLADLPKEAASKARTEAELRDEIRKLKGELAARPKEPVLVKAPAPKPEIKEVQVVKPEDLRRVEKALERAEKLVGRVADVGKPVDEAAKQLRAAIGALRVQAEQRPVPRAYVPTPKPIPKQMKLVVPDKSDEGNEPLVAGERKMLGVLAQFYPGVRTRAQVAQLAGYAASGGTFGAYFGRLRRFRYIEEKGDNVQITQEGLSFLGEDAPTAPSSTAELLEVWRKKLIAGERKMLDVILEAYPEAVSKEDLGEKSGYTASGGTFGAYLGTLRRNDLVDVAGNLVRASESLFQFA